MTSHVVIAGPEAAGREFRPVVGFEDWLQVSSDGQVWSIRRKTLRKIWISRDGYGYVSERIDGVKKPFAVHRLVASAFIDNPDGFPVVNHKDLNKLNNQVENLEWTTGHGNIWHYQITRQDRRWIERTRPLSPYESKRILALHETGLITVRQLALAFGLSRSTVGRIVRGEPHATV